MTLRRKLAAILCADVAGYSRLMAGDEAATLRALNDARAVFSQHIQAHHGRLVDTAGDSVLAEFDSAVEAVSCSVEVQRELAKRSADVPEPRRMLFRLGVNLGDVMEENAGLYGDGVNVAARLQALAEPGGLCISGTVFDQVDGKLPLAFEFMGEQAVKNIPKPVRVYRVVDGAPDLKQRTPARTVWLASAAALLLIAVGASIWWQARPPIHPPAPGTSTPAAGTRPRLAVLPLDNFSAKSEDEYFSDGMTEELISKLSRVQGMDVIARTSVMRYKRTNKSIADIGRELGVNSVLEGSVRKAGDKVRITVQLIDVGSQAHLWSEDFDRELKDIFATQSEIADQVAKALHVALVAAAPASSPGNVDPETYTLYLKGRHHAGDFNADGLRKSIDYYERAVARSPDDARTWAAMSRSYASLGWWAFIPPGEAFAQARAAAEKALKLDDELADAYIALGMVRFLHDFDWDGAKQAYLKAIALAPGDSDAHLFYGIWLKALAHNAQAVEEIRRANELDPHNLMANAEIGWVEYFGHRYEAGARGCRRALEKDAAYLFALNCLQSVLAMQRDPEAIHVGNKLLRLTADDSYFLGYQGWAYGLVGQRDEAVKILAKLRQRARATEVPPPAIFYVYMGLQDADGAMDWIEKAYEGRWADVAFVKSAPDYDWLRTNPRFQALLRKMKLDDRPSE